LLLLSLSFSAFTVYISPYEDARYLFGILGLLIIIPILFIRLLPFNTLKYIMIFFLCILYIFHALNPSSIKKSHLGRFNYPAADHKINRLLFRDNSNSFVYLLHSKFWSRVLVSDYFLDDQKYKLIIDNDLALNFNETGSDEIFLIIDKDNNKQIINKLLKNSDWYVQN
jgi:hypothetical protein